MDDLFGELLVKVFGPIVIVVGVIAGIAWGVQSAYRYFVPLPPPIVQPAPEKKPLSYKAGQKTKEVGINFIKGFFN